ncbi:MAG: hypothetical protein WC650_04745 [Candidatus Doudnabacteria bacterium]
MKAVKVTDLYEGKDLLDSEKCELVIVEFQFPGSRKRYYAMVKEGDKSALFEKAHQGWAQAYLNNKHFVGYQAYYRPGLAQSLKVFLGQLREVFQEEIELEEVKI